LRGGWKRGQSLKGERVRKHNEKESRQKKKKCRRAGGKNKVQGGQMVPREMKETVVGAKTKNSMLPRQIQQKKPTKKQKKT